MSQVVPPRAKKKQLPEAVAFGKRVRELRKALDWTQEELAERAELNWLQIGHIERGASDPKLSSVFKIARALRVAPSELLR